MSVYLCVLGSSRNYSTTREIKEHNQSLHRTCQKKKKKAGALWVDRKCSVMDPVWPAHIGIGVLSCCVSGRLITVNMRFLLT